ncbi:hypothetical protein LAZ67_7002473 [Cordylochernes scorpioides]|uniref:RING-CH-type domain-containing protein n=1 Tax=Cordylochernes scorpioides TaxID=51811 RepID=A0ABY6KN59_9ARAC|nr:hypothetical protein LAZ67_7002473 [Cordylochernes scorpioides]
MFSEGREDVNDEERAGRPSTSTTDEKINEVEKMILANRRITVREVAENLNISIGSCHSIFINDLGMRRVGAKFVPKLLNCDQKQHRMNIANEMLDSVRDDPNLLQRFLCIKAEFHRLKAPSLRKACQVTPQKLLYILIFLATALRGYYFSSLDHVFRQEWASSLLSAYYPLLLTGGSLVVCLWAEMFHLGNTRESSQQFLTKSLLAFVLFNVLIYSLLAAQLFLLHSSPLQVGNLFQTMIASALNVLVTTVFNGLYALLMLVVLTFFLIYGINMFVKLRGQFAEATGERLETDHWQVQQSRLGLVSLTVLLGGTAGLLACEGPLAQSPVPHRNAHQLAIRVAELAVAIWFPCALWNCACPAQLWLLNPRRLWRPLTAAPTGHGEGKALVAPPAGTECWICYDSQRTDAGPLIQPCRCRGDVGAVHHDCLRKWLVQSLRARCAVCGENYQLAGTKWRPAPAPWLRAVAVVLVTSATVGGCGLALRLLPSPGLRVLALGLAMVSLHLGLRLLGFSLLSALRRSRLASVRILHRPPSTTILDPTAPAAPMGEHLALTGTSGAHPCPSTL